MYSVDEIVKYVIHESDKRKEKVNLIKLQKILYFIQAEFIVSENRPCFYEEIEAWEIGPIIPHIQEEYRLFRENPIPAIYVDEPTAALTKKEKEMINDMLKTLSTRSDLELISITTRQTPWEKKPMYISLSVLFL